MMYSYPVRIVPEGSEFAVYVRDLPEVVTGARTRAEALDMAADAVEVAVAGRIQDFEDLPEPSQRRLGEVMVVVPLQTAAKAAVYAAWRNAGITRGELARRLGCRESDVRRILKPGQATRLQQLEDAARALGLQLVVGTVPRPRA